MPTACYRYDAFVLLQSTYKHNENLLVSSLNIYLKNGIVFLRDFQILLISYSNSIRKQCFSELPFKAAKIGDHTQTSYS